jgi:hypothetical protein
MESRVRVLKQLVRDSMYVVDERAVAEAIVARAQVGQLVAEQSFRSRGRERRLRSFARDRDRRSRGGSPARATYAIH